MNITLVHPEASLKESYLRALKEFQAEGLPWMMGLNYDALNSDFDSYIDKLLQASLLRTAVIVPETILWAVDGDEYVGRISIRHELTEALRVEGGHIGYDTVPSFRGRGVASEMLSQALPIAVDLGLEKVLLTCNDDNVASIKVIEKNGGVLEGKRLLSSDRPLKRYYWIKL